jgi:hypothetical protein
LVVNCNSFVNASIFVHVTPVDAWSKGVLLLHKLLNSKIIVAPEGQQVCKERLPAVIYFNLILSGALPCKLDNILWDKQFIFDALSLRFRTFDHVTADKLFDSFR